jgi:hypothetical protein
MVGWEGESLVDIGWPYNRPDIFGEDRQESVETNEKVMMVERRGFVIPKIEKISKVQDRETKRKIPEHDAYMREEPSESRASETPYISLLAKRNVCHYHQKRPDDRILSAQECRN